MTRLVASCLALCALVACNGQSSERLTREELLKPESCKDCHPKHYAQWAGSMHAYASKDPVFRAMNKRGQREAKLNEFCVKCHAPMALLEGKTTDGTNLDQVPDHLQGVTCYFCHNATSVEGDHNNMLKLANDTTMRAAISDPVDPKAHDAAYSALHDGNKLKSSATCGGCHDIVTPNHMVHLERTFAEYRDSFFSRPDPAGFRADTCQGCHMSVRDGDGVIANVQGVPGNRQLHEHLWQAVDVALSAFPHRDALKAAVEDCALAQSIQYFDFAADPTSIGVYKITLETAAGHNQPSGASQDRRMWLEVTAYDRADNVVYESGKVADDEEVDPAKTTVFHDTIFNEQDKEVHMFWDAAMSPEHPTGYQSRALPYGKDASVPHSVTVTLPVTVPLLGRVEIRLRVRPMGLDVLQDLVKSGDLDAGVLKEVPTFTAYSTVIEWTKDGGPMDFNDPVQLNVPDCDHYRCMIDPMLPSCRKK